MMKISLRLVTKNKYTKDLIIYGLSTGISKAVPFLLVIVLSKYFGPKNFGILAIVQVVISMVGLVQAGPISSAIGKQFFHLERSEFSGYFSTAVNYNFLLGILCFAVISVFFFEFSSYFKISYELLVVGVICASLQSSFSCNTVLFQMSRKPIKYLKAQCIYSVFYIILVGILMLLNQLTVFNFFMAQLIAYLVGTFITFYDLIGIVNYSAKLDLAYLIHLMKYSLPIIIYSINSFLIVMYLRFTMTNTLGLFEMGVFALSQQIGMIMENTEQVVAKVWTPFAFDILSKNKINYFFKMTIIPMLVLVISFVVLLLSNEIMYRYFISQHYHAGYWCSVIILFAYLMKSFYAVFAVYTYFFEKIKYVAIINSVIGISSLFFSKWFLSRFGMIGGSFSILISYTLLFLSVSCLVLYLGMNKKTSDDSYNLARL